MHHGGVVFTCTTWYIIIVAANACLSSQTSSGDLSLVLGHVDN